MRVRRALGWSLSQQAGLNLLQFLSLVVIARLLTPDEVGVFVLALSVAAVLEAMRELGLTAYLIREPELTDDKIRAANGLLFTITGSLAVALVTLSGPLSRLFGEPGIADVLPVIAAAVLLSAVELPALSLLRREMRFDAVHHMALIAKAAGVAVAIGFAWAGASYMALAWGYLTTGALRAGICAIREPRPLRLGPSLRGWRPALAFGGWMTGTALVSAVTGAVPKLLMAKAVGTGAVALFDRGVRLSALVRQALGHAIGRVMVPIFSHDLRAGRPIGGKVEKLVGLTSAIVWPALLILGLLCDRAVLLLFGSNWLALTPLVPWIAVTTAMLCMLPAPGDILVPHGLTRRLFGLSLAKLAVATVTAVAFLPFGLSVFVMGRVLGAAANITLTWIAIGPFLGTSLRRLAGVHLRSAAAALAAAAPVAGLLAAWPGAPLLAVAGALAMAGLAWFAALHAVAHPLAGDLTALGRQLGAALARRARPRISRRAR